MQIALVVGYDGEWRRLPEVKELKSEQRPTTTACPPPSGAGRATAALVGIDWGSKKKQV